MCRSEAQSRAEEQRTADALQRHGEARRESTRVMASGHISAEDHQLDHDRAHAENGELYTDCPLGIDELRQDGGEEYECFRIGALGEQAVGERPERSLARSRIGIEVAWDETAL